MIRNRHKMHVRVVARRNRDAIEALFRALSKYSADEAYRRRISTDPAFRAREEMFERLMVSCGLDCGLLHMRLLSSVVTGYDGIPWP